MFNQLSQDYNVKASGEALDWRFDEEIAW